MADRELKWKDKVQIYVRPGWWNWFVIKRCQGGKCCRRRGCPNEIGERQLYAVNMDRDPRNAIDGWYNEWWCLKCAEEFLVEEVEYEDA